MDVGTVGGEVTLLFVEVGTCLADNAFAIQAGTQRNVQLRAGYGRCTGTVHNDFYIFNLLACYLQSVHKSGTGDDGCTMLVVVHHGDVEFFLQAAFYFETFGSFDVFQVDATESRGDGFDCLDKFLRVFLVHFDVEHVDTGVNLEKQSFTFHYGFAAQRAYIAQTEHCGTV